jgi:hypothetical protein
MCESTPTVFLYLQGLRVHRQYVFIRTYAETDGILLPQVLVTFAAFGYPV